MLDSVWCSIGQVQRICLFQNTVWNIVIYFVHDLNLDSVQTRSQSKVDWNATESLKWQQLSWVTWIQVRYHCTFLYTLGTVIWLSAGAVNEIMRSSSVLGCDAMSTGN